MPAGLGFINPTSVAIAVQVFRARVNLLRNVEIYERTVIQPVRSAKDLIRHRNGFSTQRNFEATVSPRCRVISVIRITEQSYLNNCTEIILATFRYCLPMNLLRRKQTSVVP